MEKRQLGKTDMFVTVLGYGGAEVGFQNESQEKVNILLNSASLQLITSGKLLNCLGFAAVCENPIVEIVHSNNANT